MSTSSVATRATNGAKKKQEPATTGINLSFNTVGVRFKFSHELEVLDVFHDGLSFRSPSPISGGKLLELVLGGGILMVDARVVQCHAMDDFGGHAVRVRYHELSDALQRLITDEIRKFYAVGATTTEIRPINA